jgi:peptidoglycan/LPS O-acetylase OafA/YrhL
MNTKSQHIQTRFDWIDALKAFALIGILLNHFVEVFSTGPWFTNPSSNWPDFSTRMQSLIPESENIGITIFRYMGWFGDSGPGVFILLSGLALTLSILNKGLENFNPLEFYKKRLLRIFPLYIAIHLIILLIYLFIPGEHAPIANPNTLLSLL